VSSVSPAPTRLHRGLRFTLVAGYVGVVALGFTTEVQPRIFWTVVLPLLPLSIVLMGFANWRRVCPLAFFGEIGKRLNRGAQRRVPQWFERWFLVVAFSGLLAMLVFRLVATNGDGVWLSGLLAGAALAALLTNTVFTGKTWCNFFCPVLLVERIYTEPNSLPHTSNSQCIRCTACKSSCPDIDQENAYWRDLKTSGRRIAVYAFPGLVLAFYTYYWLRYGDWEAYFDGRWTRQPADLELLLGQGWFFAPQVPAVVAATVTLVAFSAASYLLLVLAENGIGRFVEDKERRRHLTLTLAAFSAFSIFYLFAGAPTLRAITGGSRVLAFAAPLLATLFLAKRWGRTRESFLREKGATKLLRNWPFDEPPPTDASEVYGWIKAGEHAREQNISAYASTVREMISDGLVHRGELRLLEGVRNQLGISGREHARVIERLDEQERHLFERDHDGGAEKRAQLEGYKTALAEALLRHASDAEITALRLAFDIDQAKHDGLIEQMRGDSGLLVDRARDQVVIAGNLRRDLESIATREPSDADSFLIYLLLREQCDAIRRVLDLLELIGQEQRIRTLRFRLFGGDVATRRTVIDQLAEACPGARDLVYEMQPWILEPTPVGTTRDPDAHARAVGRRCLSADNYLRAAATWVAAGFDEPWARAVLAGARTDASPLVREIASTIGRATLPETCFNDLITLEKMQFLRRVNLFENLAPEDLHDLVRFVTEETVPSGEMICEENDTESDDLFILLDGQASVLIGRREVAILGTGEVIGEMSMLDGSPRSATVLPKDGPVRLLRISGERFRNRLLLRSRVARPLLATLAQRIRNVSH
jgi:hypothetical protein